MTDRSGNRKSRGMRPHRRPKLGYYFVVTDTKETEKNYLEGLRNSIPKDVRDKLVMKVSRVKTLDLVDEALNLLSMHPQYGEPWIVFDRDRVKNFDSIIHDAKVNGVKVGWSNPCIEIWFHAYFGKMPMCSDSGACCKDFEMSYLNAVKQKYVKSDRNIYTKLCQHGDEIRALQMAKRKYEEHQRHGVELPSDMCPCTTLNVLVEEIKKKAGD